jgi:hypothetical protein
VIIIVLLLYLVYKAARLAEKLESNANYVGAGIGSINATPYDSGADLRILGTQLSQPGEGQNNSERNSKALSAILNPGQFM